MVEAAERARMGATLGMRCGESMLATTESSRPSPMKAATTIESTPGSIEVRAISENSAVGYVTVVVKHNIVVTPIRSPVAPSPAKAAKEADSKPQAKSNSRAANVKAGI